MGKWSDLKGKLVRFTQEPAYQVRVDVVKAKYAERARSDWCVEYRDLRAKKDLIEESIEEINLQLAALNQLLVDDLEAAGELRITTTLGTFALKDEPYPQVKDKHALVTWTREQGLAELLTLNYQTLAGLVKDRLDKGQPIPDGVDVFMKTSISYYAPR